MQVSQKIHIKYSQIKNNGMVRYKKILYPHHTQTRLDSASIIIIKPHYSIPLNDSTSIDKIYLLDEIRQ